MQKKRKTFAYGFIMGLLVPAVGFFLVKGVFLALAYFGMIGTPSPAAAERRLRTITLLAICLNVFPVHYHRLRSSDRFLRGLISACFLYIIIWVIYFSSSLQLDW